MEVWAKKGENENEYESEDDFVEAIRVTRDNIEDVLQILSKICETIDIHFEADNDYMDCEIMFNNGHLHIPFGNYLVRTRMKIPCFLPEENYYVVLKEHQLKADYRRW